LHGKETHPLGLYCPQFTRKFRGGGALGESVDPDEAAPRILAVTG